MDVSVITPSLNMLDYLKRCHASVVDQHGVNLEHIVMDGCSTDGTAVWLGSTPSLVGVVAPDEGMYDAINKGFHLARGDVLSYLNCDEQYLPGTLSFIKEYFDAHPDVDIIAGDTLLIRPDGSLIAYRKTYPLPLLLVLASDLHVHTSSMFFRRTILDRGDYFDKNFRYVGDQEYFVRLMRKKYRFAFCRRYLSAFTMTGRNRGMTNNAISEGIRLRSQVPAAFHSLVGPIHIVRWIIKFLTGSYFQRMPLVYSVYDSSEVSDRRVFVAQSASFRYLEA